jgi:hypothetical protein
MPITPVVGLPGLRGLLTANHRTVFLQSGPLVNLAGGRVIDGTLSRDSGNVGAEDHLRAGLVMGMVTATGKYRPSILGLSNVAYVDNDTTITVDARTATEVARLRAVAGGNVNLKFTGPPSAAGTVAATAITVTATSINGATSTLTVGDLNLAKVTGSLITPADGSETALLMLPDGYPIRVTEPIDGSAQDQPFPFMPIWAIVETSKLIDYPADAASRTYLKQMLSTLVGGKYSFSDTY